MFRLIVDRVGENRRTIHASRDDAVVALRAALAGFGADYRVVTTGWSFSSYRLTNKDGPRSVGWAQIEEICACEHSEREHRLDACAEFSVVNSVVTECDCRRYRPLAETPTLFDIPLSATLGVPLRVGS